MKHTLSKKLLGIAMTFVFAFALVVPMVTLAAGDFGLDQANFDTLEGSGTQDLHALITKIMVWLFSFLGILAVLVILYGGFKWMTAGGDDDKVGEAKKLIINGIIGLIIILSAYAIATFVFNEVSTNLLNS